MILGAITDLWHQHHITIKCRKSQMRYFLSTEIYTPQPHAGNRGQYSSLHQWRGQLEIFNKHMVIPLPCGLDLICNKIEYHFNHWIIRTNENEKWFLPEDIWLANDSAKIFLETFDSVNCIWQTPTLNLFLLFQSLLHSFYINGKVVKIIIIISMFDIYHFNPSTI